MRKSTSLSVLLLLMALATPAFAQILDDSGAGTDITPNAPAAVNIFPAPAAPTIGVAPPTIPNVFDLTTTAGGIANYGGSSSVAGANVGGGASSTGIGGAANAGTGTSPATGATNNNLDPYCAVATDPQAAVLGIDSTGCNP